MSELEAYGLAGSDYYFNPQFRQIIIRSSAQGLLLEAQSILLSMLILLVETVSLLTVEAINGFFCKAASQQDKVQALNMFADSVKPLLLNSNASRIR